MKNGTRSSTKKALLQDFPQQGAFFSLAPDPKEGHFHPLMWRGHNLLCPSSERNTSAVQQTKVKLQPIGTPLIRRIIIGYEYLPNGQRRSAPRQHDERNGRKNFTHSTCIETSTRCYIRLCQSVLHQKGLHSSQCSMRIFSSHDYIWLDPG